MKTLLIDNDRLLLDALAHRIETARSDMQVDVAADETGALALAGATQYDLILLDWWLDEEPGDARFLRLRQLNPEARIVVISGDDTGALIDRVLKLGAAGFLRKHVADFDTLDRALETVIGGDIFVPPRAGLSAKVSPSVKPADVCELSALFPNLTMRQIEVLRGMLAGHGDKRIAQTLNIAVSTTKTHVQAIYREMDIRTRSGVAAHAARLGVRVE